MIIQRYLLREIALSFAAVSLVLGLLFMSGTFVRLLGEALTGRYPADLVLTLFVLSSMGSMVLLLPFALFISVMMALGRFYRDSEMAVLSACGMGPLQIFKTVAQLATGAAILVAVLSLWVTPWAEMRIVEVMVEGGARAGVEGIIPGRFNQVEGGSVLYVERVDTSNKQLQGIFAVVQAEGQQYQLSAASGHEYLDHLSGDRYLLLQNGYRYEGEYGQAAFRIIEFAEHGIRIQEQPIPPISMRKSGIQTAILWDSDNVQDQAELQWRLAMPLTTLLLALLAVPMSKSPPRQGRMLGLFFGIVVYMGYNNLLNIARSMIDSGQVPVWLGLWWVHLVFMVLIAWLLWRQMSMPAPRYRTSFDK